MNNHTRLSFLPVTGEIVLERSAPLRFPPAGPGDGALWVMTDLAGTIPITVGVETQIDRALEHMMHAGVRLLFVVDGEFRLLGLINSYDIQGEKPVRFLLSLDCNHRTCSRSDILVKHIMEPVTEWEALAYEDVRHATVADVVAAFKTTGRRHLVVVEHNPETGQRFVRGLFSLTRLERQLRSRIEVVPRAQAFSDIEKVVEHRML
jgi:hypothetical protein